MATVRFLETDTVTLEELLGNGKRYMVPEFQRDYSWTEEQLDDLWRDVVEPPQAALPHYMGPLVLLRDGTYLKVIDGQQRLATLSILCLAVLERLMRLQTAEDQQRYDLLKSQFIGAKDPASLRWASKLSLNENDNDFFQGTLVNHRQPASVTKLRSSERRLWDAHGFFVKKLEQRFPPTTTGEELVRFFQDAVARRLAFTQITVDDELNAYTVFETLNARSLRLTSTDLLKNYLFSLLKTGAADLQQGKAQWNRVLSYVEFEAMPTFLRHYLASKQELVRAERLFKELRVQVHTREQAFDLLDALERHAIWYRALGDANDEFWSGKGDCRHHVRALRLFGVEQFKPLALAALRSDLPSTELARILRACVMVSFRYHVVGKRNPNQAEATYNEAAVGLGTENRPSATAAISRLRQLYVDDEEFTAEFETFTAHSRGRSARLTKYVLFALERQLGGPDLDFESAEETVEHVLPRGLTPTWAADFSPEDHERFVARIGNLAILKPGQNSDIGQLPYEEKKRVLAASGYKLSAEITAAEWTPASIRARQKQLAKVAKTIWRVEFP
jgi:hypothetical protein